MFSPEAQKALKNYVYRLIDPRNGETFYVGRGRGNRVFDHINDKRTDLPKVAKKEGQKDELSEKLETIRQIKSQGLEVMHIIHRHGLSRGEAKPVEAALIDVYPGLTNQMLGHDAEHGPANAAQLEKRYSAKPIEFNQSHRLVIVKINQATINERGSIYEAARYAWRLRKKRAEKANYVLVSLAGVCEEALEPTKWHDMHDGRCGFVGKQAPKNIRDYYVSKAFTDRGAKATNPVRYINCC